MPETRINIEKQIENLMILRTIISDFLSGAHLDAERNMKLATATSKSIAENGFFTQQNIKFALGAIVEMLDENKVKQWISNYSISDNVPSQIKTIGVVSAGNIPLVGFHDFLCVLVSGNRYLGKLSHQDKYLLPALSELLIEIDSRYKDSIKFTQDKIQEFDAIIATGSNNTERYFEYYFKKYPHIIRKHRNSITILNGKESDSELSHLANDMFQYFGLGCRNVSHIFVPKGYDFSLLTNACNKYSEYFDHNKFRNSYDYYKTIFLMNNKAFIDAGFYILKEEQLINNPVSVFHYEYYADISEVHTFIDTHKDNLQCVVGNFPEIHGIIPFGQAQMPQLWDYADNVDTMKFLFEEINN